LHKLSKKPNRFAIFDNILGRLEKVEHKRRPKKRRETDAEVEARFAKLRAARAKERYGPVRIDGGKGNPLTYGDVWDEVTDEEINYYMNRALKVPPEKRYQNKKKYSTTHPSSWCSRGVKTGYDGHGCNQFTGCVPESRFYADTGRIEDDEVIAHYEEWKRKRDSTTRDEKRAARQAVHGNKLIYDDDE
jgi:hypothetical protein